MNRPAALASRLATLACLALAFARMASAETPALVQADPAPPAWRGSGPGLAWLGHDVLWRARDAIIFHMHDAEGGGFTLDFTVRDMNVYHEGPRPVFFRVVGPSGRTRAQRTMPDDGIVAGNHRYKDGIPDVYADFRFREWHRVHSPGGRPPGKQRSPALERPETLPARPLRLTVEDDGPGLYRVVVIASYDHWISIVPNRPIPTGVHPGPGPLYVHGNRLDPAYFYAPPNVKDIAISLTEEVQPFGWRMVLEDLQGNTLGETQPRSFMSYLGHTDAQGDAVYRLRVAGGQPGANLHLAGVPAVLCPDPQSARLIAGGVHVDEKGRHTFHAHQRVLNGWADSLRPEDLAVEAEPTQSRHSLGVSEWVLADVPEILASQILDPESPEFGNFRDDGGYWARKADALLAAAVYEGEANPYQNHPGMIRRIALRHVAEMRTLTPYFWYRHGNDWPYTYAPKADSLWSIPVRSYWYPMVDMRNPTAFYRMREAFEAALPADAVAAWKQSIKQASLSRAGITQGETSNQPVHALGHVLHAHQLTDDPRLLGIVNDRMAMLLNPLGLGRTRPMAHAADLRSEAGYGFASDTGMLGIGVMGEAYGFDAEYNLYQVHVSRSIWQITRDPAIVAWWNTDYWLKTHLTLPRRGRLEPGTFQWTASPTDINHRTQGYTHKDPLPAEARHQVNFGDLWAGDPNPERTWPALETEPFLRHIDNQFYFVNTGAYYAIAYAGPARDFYAGFTAAALEDGSAWLQGYGGPGYGGRGLQATKIGAVSAVFVRDCGPTVFSTNHDVMYTHTVWARTREPNWPWRDIASERDVDPRIDASGYASPTVEFDMDGRVYRRTERMLYVPLIVDRTLRYKDDRIVVTLQLTATGNVNLDDLREAMPYYANKRTIRLFDAELAESGTMRPLGPNDDATEAPMEPLTLRAFEIAGPGGAGTTVIYDRAYAFTQVPPYRYRDIAAYTRSMNLPLPRQLDAGRQHTVRYVIYNHSEPVTPERLRAIAEEEGLMGH